MFGFGIIFAKILFLAIGLKAEARKNNLFSPVVRERDEVVK